jgi:hypothetical protein
MADLPGRRLGQELMEKSREESRTTPMEAVIAAAQAGRVSDEASFRLIGHLWTLERMFYYIYGGLGPRPRDERFPSGRQISLFPADPG